MILSFKERFKNGKPTNFEFKILKCLLLKAIIDSQAKGIIDVDERILKAEPKLHSIRADTSNRWHVGRTIQCAKGVRTNKYKCFASLKCISTQTFLFHGFGSQFGEYSVEVDCRNLSETEIIELAENDGFDDVKDFVDFFISQSVPDENEMPFFSGKIIHWTDKRY